MKAACWIVERERRMKFGVGGPTSSLLDRGSRRIVGRRGEASDGRRRERKTSRQKLPPHKIQQQNAGLEGCCLTPRLLPPTLGCYSDPKILCLLAKRVSPEDTRRVGSKRWGAASRASRPTLLESSTRPPPESIDLPFRLPRSPRCVVCRGSSSFWAAIPMRSYLLAIIPASSTAFPLLTHASQVGS